MNPTIVFAVTISLLTLSYVATTNNTMTVILPGYRVVGGEEAEDNQFPYQVMVIMQENAESYMCGGSVLTSRYVLTAAHCMKGRNPIDVYVLAGFVETDDRDWVMAQVGEIYVHKFYSSEKRLNDLALLQLVKRLPLDGKKIDAIPLRQSEVTPDTRCVVSGWGATEQNGQSSDDLRYVYIPVVDKLLCSSMLGIRLAEGMMCAGYISGGKDSCQGDSGGPLVCDGLLTGVVSWGDGCAKKNKPGVYTEVSVYYSWLEKTMESSSQLDSASAVTSLGHMVIILNCFSTLLYHH